MTTIAVPVELPLNPLKRISPSKFTALKKCRLREVWSAASIEPLLPSSPAAKLGLLIHSVLEKAGKGEIREIDDFDQVWNGGIKHLEAQMRAFPLENHLVPLAESAFYFEVKKQQCLRMVKEILQTSGFGSGVRHEPAGTKNEIWMETPGGEIGGKVDRLVHTSDGDIIMDFKSGAIFEDAPGHQNIKDEYQTQLKLYAALYLKEREKLPTALRIISLDGKAHNVEFSREECEKLLEEALAMLSGVNAIINSVRTPEEKEQALSSPSSGVCKFCSYRPGCRTYFNLINEKYLTEGWPVDLKGTVVESQMLGNGKIFVELISNKKKKFLIRGLNPLRHNQLKTGTEDYVFFSVRKESDGSEETFIEGPMTTIYRSHS